MGQRGSHVKLRSTDGRVVIVPMHSELKAGTLRFVSPGSPSTNSPDFSSNRDSGTEQIGIRANTSDPSEIGTSASGHPLGIVAVPSWSAVRLIPRSRAGGASANSQIATPPWLEHVPRRFSVYE